MNLYKVTRKDGRFPYDEYDSFVASATSPTNAKGMHPSGDHGLTDARWQRDWPLPAELNCKLIGWCDHKRPRVVVASFNAG